MPKEKIKKTNISETVKAYNNRSTATEGPNFRLVRRSRWVCIRKQISKVQLP